MLYNKKKVRKVNDKKMLRKKGKRWVTVSLGLLAAIGTGAVATNATASADQTNSNQVQTQTTQVLNTSASNVTTNEATSQGSEDASSANTNEQSVKAQSNISENNILSTKLTSASVPAVHNVVHKSVQTTNIPVGTNGSPKTVEKSASPVQSGNGSSAIRQATKSSVGSANNNVASSADIKGTLKQHADSLSRSLKGFKPNSLIQTKKSAVAKASVKSVSNNQNSNTGLAGVASKSNNAKHVTKNTSFNTQLSNSAKVNVHFGNNGDLNVDGNAVTAVPDNDQDNNNYQAFDNTDQSTDKAPVAGNNNKNNNKDPYESDPYNPILTFSFANINAGDMPVGQDTQVKAQAGEQFNVTKNGVSINGKSIQVPKGYNVDNFGNDYTYAVGRYTVMPRMNIDGAWDAENYTIGVKSANTSQYFSVKQPTKATLHKTLLGANEVGGGTGANNNNVPAGTTGNGGASNNNLVPNGPIFNNSGDNSANDSAMAALINNESRDAQGTMNRMQTSASSTESAMASEAAASASNSAAAVSLAESGQNAATIQNMNNSSEVNSIANASAESSAENSLHNADTTSMNNFEGSVNSERATINSDDINTLNSLAQMSNLTSDQYNSAVYGMQSAESTYLDQLSHASNAAEWNTITSDYVANLKSVITNAANANTNNRGNDANSIFNTINSDETEVNSLLASDGAINSAQRASLDSGFTSDASNASNMAQLDANNSGELDSIANSLNNDKNGIESAASLSGMNNSNSANASNAAALSSADANINFKRNNDINSVNNNSSLTSSEKAQINSEINSAADGLLAANKALSAGSNSDDLAGDKRNATNTLNSDEISDRNYVNANPSLNSAQQSSMDNQLAGMAESGVNAIDQAADDPDVQLNLANAQNAMAKYSGNLNAENPDNLDSLNNYNYDPYAYDNDQDPYGSGLTHYDPTEWNNEAQLAAAYARYLGEGYPLVKLTTFNNEAFHYGLVDAANGLEANPAITKYAPYRDGYTSYASGFHDGEFGISPADLTNYGELYQKSYQEAYTNGQTYRKNNHQMIDDSFTNGYKASRKSMLAMDHLEGHSHQYIQGYIQGLNDRLKGHPDYLLVNKSLLLHRAPEFMKNNVLAKFYGGNRRHATELVVNGASVDEAGNVRYHVIAVGRVNGKSKHVDGWVTANHAFVKDTYYRANDARTRGNMIHVLTKLQVHSDMQSIGTNRNVVRVIRAGRNIRIRGIVRDGDITRFYIAPGEYITTNKGFVQWLR